MDNFIQDLSISDIIENYAEYDVSGDMEFTSLHFIKLASKKPQFFSTTQCNLFFSSGELTWKKFSDSEVSTSLNKTLENCYYVRAEKLSTEMFFEFSQNRKVSLESDNYESVSSGLLVQNGTAPLSKSDVSCEFSRSSQEVSSTNKDFKVHATELDYSAADVPPNTIVTLRSDGFEYWNYWISLDEDFSIQGSRQRLYARWDDSSPTCAFSLSGFIGANSVPEEGLPPRKEPFTTPDRHTMLLYSISCPLYTLASLLYSSIDPLSSFHEVLYPSSILPFFQTYSFANSPSHLSLQSVFIYQIGKLRIKAGEITNTVLGVDSCPVPESSHGFCLRLFDPYLVSKSHSKTSTELLESPSSQPQRNAQNHPSPKSSTTSTGAFVATLNKSTNTTVELEEHTQTQCLSNTSTNCFSAIKGVSAEPFAYVMTQYLVRVSVTFLTLTFLLLHTSTSLSLLSLNLSLCFSSFLNSFSSTQSSTGKSLPLPATFSRNNSRKSRKCLPLWRRHVRSILGRSCSSKWKSKDIHVTARGYLSVLILLGLGTSSQALWIGKLYNKTSHSIIFLQLYARQAKVECFSEDNVIWSGECLPYKYPGC